MESGIDKLRRACACMATSMDEIYHHGFGSLFCEDRKMSLGSAVSPSTWYYYISILVVPHDYIWCHMFPHKYKQINSDEIVSTIILPLIRNKCQ
jgi:hypothetical protein